MSDRAGNDGSPAGGSVREACGGHEDATIGTMRVAHVNDIAFVGSAMVAALRDGGIDARLIDPPRPGRRIGYPWRLATLPLRALALGGAVLKTRWGDYDVVHVHYARFGFLGAMSGRPYVVECHGTDIRGIAPRSAWGREVGPFLRRAAAVLYATPDLAPWVQAFRPDAVFVPNPIDIRAASGADVEPDRDVLVGVRLDEGKGASRIAQLLEMLVAARPSTTVTVVAHGPALSTVARAAGRDVTILPPVAHADMPGLLRRHRIVFGQQRLGALGNYELEALAVGVPVVTHYRHWDAYPIDPPVVDDRSASRVTPRVLALLEDDVARAALGQQGRGWVARYHAPSTIARGLIEMYSAALATSPP